MSTSTCVPSMVKLWSTLSWLVIEMLCSERAITHEGWKAKFCWVSLNTDPWERSEQFAGTPVAPLGPVPVVPVADDVLVDLLLHAAPASATTASLTTSDLRIRSLLSSMGESYWPVSRERRNPGMGACFGYHGD